MAEGKQIHQYTEIFNTFHQTTEAHSKSITYTPIQF